MEPLLSAAESKACDEYTKTQIGIPESVLMEHAAMAVVESLRIRFGKALLQTRGMIVAGSGDNGGDALCVARMLYHLGCSDLSVVSIGDEKKMSQAFIQQRNILSQLGLPIHKDIPEEKIQSLDWIVDGIFGTGLCREVSGKMRDTIDLLNGHFGKKWIVAVDIPSGLSSDTGLPLGIAIHASVTVTFGFLKRGLLTGKAHDYVGELFLATIQIPRTISTVLPSTFLFQTRDIVLPSRSKSGHKGLYGHVVVFGGEKEGAGILSTTGALRAGTGLVTLIASEKSLSQIRPCLLPEVLTQVRGLNLKTPEGAVLMIGPGFGLEKEHGEQLRTALKGTSKLVLDADALTLISKAQDGSALFRKRAKELTVITPHPKEAARLLGKTTEEVESDRFQAVADLVEKFQATVLLKGRGTLVGYPGESTVLVAEGDSSLSKGGSGDVLSGVIAGLSAQGMSLKGAATSATFLMGRAARLLSCRFGTERASLGTEIAATLPEVIGELEACKALPHWENFGNLHRI